MSQLSAPPSVPPGGDPSPALALAEGLCATVGAAVRGKDEVVRLSVAALLAGGHLLLEDLPGTGKTLLAKSLAIAIGGHFGRVQCTPDLLPSDLTGTSVYVPVDGSWTFRPGPLFANVVLVDEINRASPRTQAALLEPMEEHQVSVDGTTHALPSPFFCIAAQNPSGRVGTSPLPESQLDRFTPVLTGGLPGRHAEREGGPVREPPHLGVHRRHGRGGREHAQVGLGEAHGVGGPVDERHPHRREGAEAAEHRTGDPATG